MIDENKGGKEIKMVKCTLKNLIKKEEGFWHIRSRTNWLSHGVEILNTFITVRTNGSARILLREDGCKWLVEKGARRN